MLNITIQTSIGFNLGFPAINIDLAGPDFLSELFTVVVVHMLLL